MTNQEGKIIGFSVCFFVGVVLASLIADCAGGKTRFLECYVADREYKPAWTEITSSRDSDGKKTFHTTRHPEEYHLICFEYGQGMVDVHTTKEIYYRKTNQEPVTVKIREGRWTKAKWLPIIE